MSALTSPSPSAAAAFHSRYSRPSPKSPVSRLPPTSSPALVAPSYARTPLSQPQTADAGTQYTPEGYPPTANKIAGSKRRGSSPPLPSMPAKPETTLPERPANVVPTLDPEASPSVTKRPRTTPSDPNLKVMPLKYETCNPKDLGYLISNMLMELIRLNDKLPLNGRLTRFHSR